MKPVIQTYDNWDRPNKVLIKVCSFWITGLPDYQEMLDNRHFLTVRRIGI